MVNRVIEQDIKRIISDIEKEAKALEGKTLLISGGAGFLGKYIVATIDRLNKRVLKNPCKVISVDSYITGQKRSILDKLDEGNLKQVEHDVTKPLSVDQQVDYIIHAAGLAQPIHYKKYPLETIDSAVFGTKNLLEFAKDRQVKSLLFFSSSEIYGDPDPNFIPTPETYRGNVSSIGPRACYDESKRLGETLCMTYFELFKVPVKIVRPFNVYGPGMGPDDRRVIPAFLTRALRGEALHVHNSGNQTRTFCYISDVTTGFFKVLLSEKNGRVYNVGNDEGEINMMSLAKVVGQLFDNKIKIKTISYPKSYPKGEPKRRCPDLTRIRKELGYVPKVNLKLGLKKMLRWYKEEVKLS